MFKGRKVPKHADRPIIFSVMYFVNLRLRLGPSLEDKGYCGDRNLAKCYT